MTIKKRKKKEIVILWRNKTKNDTKYQSEKITPFQMKQNLIDSDNMHIFMRECIISKFFRFVLMTNEA